jgi:hypothetical protein
MRKLYFLCLPLLLILTDSCRKDKNKHKPLLNPSRTAITIHGKAGDSDTFSIQSNIDWELKLPTAADWLELDKANGGPGRTIIKATAISNNINSAARTVEVSVNPVGATAVQSLVITITQEASPPGAPSVRLRWQKAMGGTLLDYASSIDQTTDGGYIIAGVTNSHEGDITNNHGESDMWVVKLDSSGNIVWQKTLGGSGFDEGSSVIGTPDGGYAIAGNTNSADGDVTGYHDGGRRDMWVVKLNSNGNIIWQKALGGSQDETAYSIIATPDGGYAVAGSATSTNGDVTGNKGRSDVWVVKLNANGNIMWQKNLGGSSDDIAHSIINASGGGYAIAAYTESADGDVAGNHGRGDMWIVKLDNSGNTVWQKTLGGSGLDNGNHITATPDGGYAVSGLTSSADGDVTGNHGGNDMWVVKLDGNGNKAWQKTLGGSSSDGASAAIVTADGGYILAGSTSSKDGDVTGNHEASDMWVVKLNSNAAIMWQVTMGGLDLDHASCIIATSDGGFAAAGYTASYEGDVTGQHGYGDAWVVKLR